MDAQAKQTSTNNETVEPLAVAEPELSLKDFLETVPPGSRKIFSDKLTPHSSETYLLSFPTINLFCPHVHCGGVRLFEPQGRAYIGKQNDNFVSFICRNCHITTKTYALRLSIDKANRSNVFKFGEVPPFGPPTPSRVRSLVGAEGDYYFKGTRSENQGLGIAAFAYYRRIIEKQKDKIFDEIIRVAQKLGESDQLVDDLRAAKSEGQFSTAVGKIKSVLPQVLLIDGHNPLTLLHSALSEGLHAQTDQECLELATSIRVVLTEFVDRVGIALKNEAVLQGAIGRLSRKSP